MFLSMQRLRLRSGTYLDATSNMTLGHMEQALPSKGLLNVLWGLETHKGYGTQLNDNKMVWTTNLPVADFSL